VITAKQASTDLTLSKELCLCAAETGPITAADTKTLEAAHHIWQGKIMGSLCKAKDTNKETLENIVKYKHKKDAAFTSNWGRGKPAAKTGNRKKKRTSANN